jgi:hypothetical protein
MEVASTHNSRGLGLGTTAGLGECSAHTAKRRRLEDLSVEWLSTLVFTNVVNKVNSSNSALKIANFGELPPQSIAETLHLGYEFAYVHYMLRPRRREVLEIEEISVTSDGGGDSPGGGCPRLSASLQ